MGGTGHDGSAGSATRNLPAARDLASELAAQAGRLQVDRRSTVVVGGTKAHANDFVSDVDLDSERLIVAGLSDAWPHDGILAEEENSAPGSTGWRGGIDPLDGTRNYLSGAGPWSVCIALQEQQTTRVAVVHDPAAGETFSAVSGEGALLGASASPRHPRPSSEWGPSSRACCPASAICVASRRDWPSRTSRPAGSTPPYWSTPSSGTSLP